MRVIAATNKSLETEMAEGRFREDLFYRLNVIPFHVPPLRERREDIPGLVDRFLQRYTAEAGKHLMAVSEAAMARLTAHPWPGNVRELQNIVERLVLMTAGAHIDVEHLPPHLVSTERESRPRTSPMTPLAEARASFEREYLIEALRENGWNISRTSEVVGLARESLSRKLRSLKIDVDKQKESE